MWNKTVVECVVPRWGLSVSLLCFFIYHVCIFKQMTTNRWKVVSFSISISVSRSCVCEFEYVTLLSLTMTDSTKSILVYLWNGAVYPCAFGVFLIEETREPNKDFEQIIVTTARHHLFIMVTMFSWCMYEFVIFFCCCWIKDEEDLLTASQAHGDIQNVAKSNDALEEPLSRCK